MKTVVSVLLVFLLSTFSAEAKTKHGSKCSSKHYSKHTHKQTSKNARSKQQPKKEVCTVKKNLSIATFSAVVIDAGHGGHDLGGIPQNIIPEKGVTLDVALRLNRALQRAGLRTILTRKDDTFIPLNTRVAIANAHPEAIFVSIHFDATSRSTASGIDAFYASPGEAPLAAVLQRHLMATTDGTNRGIKPARFRVLRKTTGRAVLVECGFLTNPHDVSLAQRASYRQKLAEQISAGIVEYRRSL